MSTQVTAELMYGFKVDENKLEWTSREAEERFIEWDEEYCGGLGGFLEDHLALPASYTCMGYHGVYEYIIGPKGHHLEADIDLVQLVEIEPPSKADLDQVRQQLEQIGLVVGEPGWYLGASYY